MFRKKIKNQLPYPGDPHTAILSPMHEKDVLGGSLVRQLAFGNRQY